MSRLTASAPLLLVADVVAAAKYYQECLGFRPRGFHGEPPCFCICERDRMFLMLAQTEPGKITPFWKIRQHTWNAYFWVDDADALYAQVKAAGARIDYEPHTKPYGVREFGIQDLDGHDIGFGQVLESRDGAPLPE